MSLDDGMKVRREVLGDVYVDRAMERRDEFTDEWQEFLTKYAWGEVWNRPGLDRKMRSCVTLTALIAGGHLEEFKGHVRGAVNNGLTQDEVKEIILQSAIYCGVPAANSAFAVAQQVMGEIRSETAKEQKG